MLKKWGKEKQVSGIQHCRRLVSQQDTGKAPSLQNEYFPLAVNSYLQASFLFAASWGCSRSKDFMWNYARQGQTWSIPARRVPALPKEHSWAAVLGLTLCEISGMWWALDSMSGESLCPCWTGVVYKLWLLRNVLKCRMLIFCGLDEANAGDKK